MGSASIAASPGMCEHNRPDCSQIVRTQTLLANVLKSVPQAECPASAFHCLPQSRFGETVRNMNKFF